MARISESKIVRRDDPFFDELLAFYKDGLAVHGVCAHLVYDKDCISPDRMIVCLAGDVFKHSFTDIVFVLYDSDSISEKSKSIIDDHSYFEGIATGNGGILYGVNYLFSYGMDKSDLDGLKLRLQDYLSENTDFFKTSTHEIIKSYHRDIVKFRKSWKKNLIL